MRAIRIGRGDTKKTYRKLKKALTVEIDSTAGLLLFDQKIG